MMRCDSTGRRGEVFRVIGQGRTDGVGGTGVGFELRAERRLSCRR